MINDQLKAKYWKGWISADTIKHDTITWLDSWFATAIAAENEDFQLLVFKVPTQRNPLYTRAAGKEDPVVAIERLLQEMYGS